MKRKHAKRIARALERIAAAMERAPALPGTHLGDPYRSIKWRSVPEGSASIVLGAQDAAGWTRPADYPPGAVVSLCGGIGS